MMIHTSFFTLVLMILYSILTVIQAAEIPEPCPNDLNQIDMCADDTVIEDSNDGGKAVDSVLLRITKHQNNCICHVSLHKNATNYTIYMSKYEGQSNAAPEQQNCGLAVDVKYSDTSDTSQSLQSINCTSGTSMRSIVLGGSNLILKSRIISGDFTRGYCMQIYRNQAILSCIMNDQIETVGSDYDWILTNGKQHSSLYECKQYCLQTEACLAVSYDSIYCYVYNKTTTLTKKDDSTYSQKLCVDIQKLKVRCFPSESSNNTSQGTTTESTTTTSHDTPPKLTTSSSKKTTEDNRSTKTKTETTPISDSTMTSSSTYSTSKQLKNDTIKGDNSDLYVYIGAAAGGVLMILLIIGIIMCIRKRSNQTSLKETQHDLTQKFSDDNRDSNYDYGGLKDNILYVSSEPNEILEDGNYNTVDLEQTRKVNQDNNYDGNYSTVDGICSNSSLSKSKPVVKPKPKTNSGLKRGTDEETIHLSTMDNSNNEYAVVDKGRNSDAVNHINPENRSETEYAVVNKVRKSSNKN